MNFTQSNPIQISEQYIQNFIDKEKQAKIQRNLQFQQFLSQEKQKFDQIQQQLENKHIQELQHLQSQLNIKLENNEDDDDDEIEFLETFSTTTENTQQLSQNNNNNNIQLIQDKLQKEHRIRQKNDQLIGKKRSQRAWTEDEDLLLTHFHKIFNGKWDQVASQIPGRNTSQALQRFRKTQENLQKKNRKYWTQEEDQKLVENIQSCGKNWNHLSKIFPDRSGKQIRERYINCLDPEINWSNFTEKEDQIIQDLQDEFGPKWALISKILNQRGYKGRPENMVKNRFHAHLKPKRIGLKQYEKEQISSQQLNQQLQQSIFN